MRRVILGLILPLILILAPAGCLGPALYLPPEHPGPHEWACAFRTCPIAAGEASGTLRGSRYDRRRKKCICQITDERDLPIWREVPLRHEDVRTLPPSDPNDWSHR